MKDRVQWAHKIRREALTFDDVLLVPRLAEIHPRDVDIRSRFTRNITINVPKITEKDRLADAEAEKEAARQAAEAKLPHYGKFVLGPSAMVRSMAVPTPKGSKAEVKPGPPDRITVTMKATGAEWRAFYSDALRVYKWSAAGNCWQRQHPASNKSETLCVEPSNTGAVIQITEK